MSETDTAHGVTPWDALSRERQTELLIAFGYYQDSLPKTCSLDEKNDRFSQWLMQQGVVYTPKQG